MIGVLLVPAIDGDRTALFEAECDGFMLGHIHKEQQWERDGQTSFRSLADYVAPRETGLADYLGAFAVTTGLEIESLVEQFLND